MRLDFPSKVRFRTLPFMTVGKMWRHVFEGRTFRVTAPVLGLIGLLNASSMVAPLGIAMWRADYDRLALGGSILISAVLGFGLFHLRKPGFQNLRRREAILAVAGSWIAVAVTGALPFVFSGVLDPVDALFESVSGFTTTGASVISEIEALPAGILFWRSLTHWLGGMGILVLAVVVLPALGTGGYQLFRTEAPALHEDRLRPRIAQTARALFGIYVLLTVGETVLLTLGGLSVFDALTHAFGTIATGGFSTRNASVGAYGSLYIEVVIVTFMILGSLPFGVHYRALGRPRTYFESAQVRLHLMLLVGACALVALELWARGVYSNAADAVRYGTFQVTSLMTTTGFATADSEKWPPFSQLVLLIVMLLGGCTGSTSGAIKIYRIMLVGRLISHQSFLMAHPHAVRPLRVEGQVVDERIITAAGLFFIAYLGVALLGAFTLAMIGVDALTAFSATAATLGGVGPGLGGVGPYDNYAWMPDSAKLVCIALMLLGRLEIFTLAVIFHPRFWRR